LRAGAFRRTPRVWLRKTVLAAAGRRLAAMNLAVLLIFLLVAAYTDLQQGKVFNKTTYTGMITAAVMSTIATIYMSAVGDPAVWDIMIEAAPYGLMPLPAAVTGWFACGVMMIICYVFFAGGVGGGDVKLIAMTGAFLGIMSGFEAMLWTFIVAACAAIILLIWQVGAVKLLTRWAQYGLYLVRFASRPAVTEEDRQPLRRALYLAPCTVAGVLLAKFNVFDLIGW